MASVTTSAASTIASAASEIRNVKSLMSDNFCVVDVVSCRDDDDLGGAKAETPPTASRMIRWLRRC